MRRTVLSCLLLSLPLTGLADKPVTQVQVTNPVEVSNTGLFSVPFFIENINATAPSALRADFTLTKPAVLESFYISCAGAPRGGILYVDGGPAGVNGTTGAGATPDVGLVVGLFSNLMIPLQIDFTVAADGVYYFSPVHLGLPVKSNYTFIVFPNAPSSVQCNGNAVFRTLD